MIPDPEALASAWERLAPSFGLPPRASLAALRSAMREADHLADDVYDVPASMLFALGRTPRCFSGFRTMSVLAVELQTKTLGFKLEATRAELCEMLLRVASREIEYEGVRAWVVTKLLPFGG